MGSCLSKKTTTCSSSTTALPDPPDPKTKPTPQPQVAEKKKSEEDNLKKEIFLIKHRISHDSADRKFDEGKPKSDPKCASIQNSTITTTITSEAADIGGNLLIGGGGVVRTSSCSKEEIDAILIQCGRLSRSSSTGKAVGGCSGDRKFSGSKRSYDFDHEKGNDNDKDDDDVIHDGAEADAERTHRHRQRHRQSSPYSSSSGRRRTPSRERDQQDQRSGSRERGSGGGGDEGRRVSRSPGRRSESPIITNTSTTTAITRPGKMVSIPATVFSMAMDKSGIEGGCGVEPPSAAAIKRILVKRNVGAAASPRARSPAATRVSNEKQNSSQTNQPLSLSRSNSRKAENSPYRRNPLGEIDQNCIGVEVPINKASTNIVSQAPIQKPNADNVKINKNTGQRTENKTISVRAKEEQQLQKMEDEGKPLHPNTRNITVTMVPSGPESLKPQMVTSTRSARLSRDLDLNPETLLNRSPTSYTALLLEDIQSFHQKSTPGMSLPPCLTKACSILDAVADLNSTTISNLSEQFGKKKRLETKEPFVDSEVIGGGDLMEPSFHKHVTVSRSGGGGSGDTEEVESSGSNSFIGGGQNWISSSLSADSTDTWKPLRLGEKREGDQKHNGIGRGRVGSGRDLQSTTLKAGSS